MGGPRGGATGPRRPRQRPDAPGGGRAVRAGDPRDPRTAGGSSRPVDAAGRRAPPPRLPDLPGNRRPRHDGDHLAGQRRNVLRPRDGIVRAGPHARGTVVRLLGLPWVGAARPGGPRPRPSRTGTAGGCVRDRECTASGTGGGSLDLGTAPRRAPPVRRRPPRWTPRRADSRHRPRIAHLCPPRIAPPPGGAAVPGAAPDAVPAAPLEAGPLGRALLQDQTISELAVAPAVPLRDRRPPGRRRHSHRLGDLAPRCGPARARGRPAGPPLRHPGDRRLGRRRAARSTRGSRAPAARGNVRARPRPPRPRRVPPSSGLPSRSPCIPNGR